LLLDVNIDGEDSRSFCQKIKAEKHEAIKVILMSGDESTLDYNEWNEADDFIAKPFDTNLLLQKISFHLTQKV
jgi:DNA-binding response OmpR family regulator